VARTALASALGGKLGAMVVAAGGADQLMMVTGLGSLCLVFFFVLFVRGHGPQEE